MNARYAANPAVRNRSSRRAGPRHDLTRAAIEEARADKRLGLHPEGPPNRVRDICEPALGIDREDDVRRVLDQEAEAFLRFAELPLQARLLAHVANAAVRAGEAALLVGPGERDELGGDRVPVAMQEIDAPAELALAGVGQRAWESGVRSARVARAGVASRARTAIRRIALT